ncbi:MAG: cytochrome C [Verrucomicrobia bacterium]|nr:cytochrome C [Deltaproteobacteria bacterium]
MKKLFFIVAILGCALVILQQKSYAEKTAHKDFASMKFKDCNSCHKDGGVAPTHDSDWVRGHRIVAGKADGKCKECHQQAWCLDCHQGGGSGDNLSISNFGRDYKPKSHRSDFRVLHPLKAKDNPQTCVRCHDQKYCSECHSKFPRNKIQFESHRRQFSNIQLQGSGPAHQIFNASQCQTCHPGGLVPTHQWSGEHAREARRNLQACQTCHEDGDVCMKCHSSRTGLKVSPHPRNWGSIKDNLRSRSNGRSCIKCHNNF